MINPIQLAETLRCTYVFRRRNGLWISRTQNKIESIQKKIENLKDVPLSSAEDYIRESILVQSSELLRDYHLKSLKIDSESAPRTYQLLMGGGLESMFGGEKDV